MLALTQRKSSWDKESSMGIEAIVTFQTLSLVNLLTSLRLNLSKSRVSNIYSKGDLHYIKTTQVFL